MEILGSRISHWNQPNTKKHKAGKTVRLDIAATADNGTKLNIEMQVKDEGNIVERSVIYQNKLRDEILREGQDYGDLPPIISIWFTVEKTTHRKYCLSNIITAYDIDPLESFESASGHGRTVIIELAKFKDVPKNLINNMLWILIRSRGRSSKQDMRRIFQTTKKPLLNLFA